MKWHKDLTRHKLATQPARQIESPEGPFSFV
jgi:hypothetical protein